MTASLTRNVPFTMCCWFYPTQIATNQIILAVSKPASYARFFLGWIPGSNVVNAAATEDDNTTSGSAGLAITPASVDNQWNFIAGVFTSTTSRTVYFNSETPVTNTTYADPAFGGSPTGFTLGARRVNSTTDAFFDGYIAYPTVWSAALSGTDIANIYNAGAGVDPSTIQSGSVVSFWPLASGDDTDAVGSSDLAPVNTPTYVADPFSISGQSPVPIVHQLLHG